MQSSLSPVSLVWSGRVHVLFPTPMARVPKCKISTQTLIATPSIQPLNTLHLVTSGPQAYNNRCYPISQIHQPHPVIHPPLVKGDAKLFWALVSVGGCMAGGSSGIFNQPDVFPLLLGGSWDLVSTNIMYTSCPNFKLPQVFPKGA